MAHHAFCGISRQHLGELIEGLAPHWEARCESGRDERRGGARKREDGAAPEHELVFTDRLLATLVHLRTGLRHPALGVIYEVDSSTIGRAISEVRPLPAARGFAVPNRPGIRLRTLEDVFSRGVLPRGGPGRDLRDQCPPGRRTPRHRLHPEQMGRRAAGPRGPTARTPGHRLPDGPDRRGQHHRRLPAGRLPVAPDQELRATGLGTARPPTAHRPAAGGLRQPRAGAALPAGGPPHVPPVPPRRRGLRGRARGDQEGLATRWRRFRATSGSPPWNGQRRPAPRTRSPQPSRCSRKARWNWARTRMRTRRPHGRCGASVWSSRPSTSRP